jgi:light-regulated signal transduction histidine kinase (bacteriophytochrome)
MSIFSSFVSCRLCVYYTLGLGRAVSWRGHCEPARDVRYLAMSENIKITPRESFLISFEGSKLSSSHHREDERCIGQQFPERFILRKHYL